MQTARDFIAALGENEDLANRLLAEIGDREGQPAYEAVSRFAQGSGYALSVDEARQAHAAYTDSMTTGDLSDDDLEAVSGGMFDPDGAKFIGDVVRTIFKGW